MHVGIIQRSRGQSAVATAAYMARAKFVDLSTGLTHDYTHKKDFCGASIIIPDFTPAEFRDREQLWNAVQKSEKRKDAQLARHLNIAIPRELKNRSRKLVARLFCIENFVNKGMIADICYHDLEGQNPHFHVMLTMRSILPNGTFGKKVVEWNKRELLIQQRKSWADICNNELNLLVNPDLRISAASLKARGISRNPQRHLGPAVFREISQQIEDVEITHKNAQYIDDSLLQKLADNRSQQIALYSKRRRASIRAMAIHHQVELPAAENVDILQNGLWQGLVKRRARMRAAQSQDSIISQPAVTPSPSPSFGF